MSVKNVQNEGFWASAWQKFMQGCLVPVVYMVIVITIAWLITEVLQ